MKTKTSGVNSKLRKTEPELEKYAPRLYRHEPAPVMMMLRHISKRFTICLLSMFFAACSGANDTNRTAVAPSNSGAPAQASPVAPSSPDNAGGVAAIAPTAKIVRAEAEGLELRAGGSAEASVRLEIAGGYHVNANPPTHAYLIPTEVDVASEAGITTGKPSYPPPLTKKFAFDPKPLAVYENTATVKVPLRAAASATKGAHTLRAKVRVQPCDDNACYPPVTIETSIPVTIN